MSDPNADTISNEGPYDGGLRRPGAWWGDRSGGRGGAGVRTTALTAAVSLVLAGGVATAAYRGLQSPTDVLTLVPASAFAVAAVDLSLPGGQDGSLSTFADHFPDSVTRRGSGSTVDRILRAVFRDSSDPHVDYDADIAPWLGDHVAVAGWTDHGSPRLEVLVQTTDDGSARSHLSHVMGSNGGLVVRDGYAVISDTDQHATDALDAAAAKSLPDDATFSADMARLPGDEAAIGWVDGPAVKSVIGGMLGGLGAGPMMGGLGPLGLPGTGNQLDGRVAAGAHVTDDTAQLDLYQVGGDLPPTTSSTRLTALPDKTVAAVEIGAPGPVVDAAVTLMRTFGAANDAGVQSCSTIAPAMPPARVLVAPGTPHRHRILRAIRKARQRAERQRQRQTSTPATPGTPSYQSICPPTPNPIDPLDSFTSATGLTLPDDLKTLLGDASVVSYGGLEIGGPPDVAIRSHPTDLARAKALTDALRSHLYSWSHVSLAVREVDGDLVLATSPAYADAVAAQGGLADQEVARLALGDVPSEVSNAGFVDLSRIWPVTGVGADDNVSHLRAFGFWATREGAALHTQMRLVVR